MNITDERLKARTLQAILLQEQGCFIQDYRRELPIPAVDLRYSHDRDEHGHFYDYECSWGKFCFDPETRSILLLNNGTPPDELIPQPRISLATATFHRGYASIHNNGASFDLDFQTRDRLDYSSLRLLNQTLADEHIPVVVWQADEEEHEVMPVIRIANESAMVFASSAIWSPDDQQLVAAQVVTTSQDLLKAVKATLANNNSKSFLTIKTPEDSAYIRSARRGFVTVASSLTPANAEGTVTALLHPLSGDPQANVADYFFLVIPSREQITQRFSERLDLAIPWPVQPAWAEYLLDAGQEAGLVEVLPQSGDDFAVGLRISKNETKWQQVISQGLKQGRISI